MQDASQSNATGQAAKSTETGVVVDTQGPGYRV